MRRSVIITSPSLNTDENVSGVSAVTKFIVDNNSECEYMHFTIGKKDDETGNVLVRIFKLLLVLAKWVRLLGKEKEALIHYNYPLERKSIIRDFFFMYYAHLKKRKLIIHIHGGLFLTKTDRPWVITKILKVVFSWGYPLIVLSENEKELLSEQFGIDNITVLPNCVPLDAAACYQRCLSDKECMDILYIGRIEKNKGIDYIIEACEGLKDAGIRFRLHIAGKEQEDYLGEIEKRLEKNFIYEGIVSGKDKDDLMKRCDVFLLPSFYEGLPIALLECMSFGMIPVCTDVGSISSVVEHGKNGFIVPLKQSEPIVDVLLELNNNRGIVKELSENAKKVIFDRFAPENYTRVLNGLYSLV